MNDPDGQGYLSQKLVTRVILYSYHELDILLRIINCKEIHLSEVTHVLSCI